MLFYTLSLVHKRTMASTNKKKKKKCGGDASTGLILNNEVQRSKRFSYSSLLYTLVIIKLALNYYKTVTISKSI